MNDNTTPKFNKPIRILGVQHCARCGADHRALEYVRFEQPIEDDDGTVWAWWATCPNTGDPVLMRDLPEGTVEIDDENHHIRKV